MKYAKEAARAWTNVRVLPRLQTRKSTLTVQMGRVVRQKSLDKLTEPKVEEQGATIRARAGTHFCNFHIRHNTDEFVHGKILGGEYKFVVNIDFVYAPQKIKLC